MKVIDFYFDYLSPYAYLAWHRLRTLSEQIEFKLELHPIPYPNLTNAWGLKGNATILPKAEFVYKDIIRFATTHHIPLKLPHFHPYKPFEPLRLSLKEVVEQDQVRLVDVLFKACWQDQIKMDDTAQLKKYLAASNFNSEQLFDRIKRPNIKQILISNMEEAIKKGIFGVPTFIVKNHLFWGNDQLPYVEKILTGDESPLTCLKNQFFLPQPTWGNIERPSKDNDSKTY